MTTNPKISVVCPTYKMKDGLSNKFLVEFLSNLTHQTYKNFEVIISDQSEDRLLEDICQVFRYCLEIKYVRNETGARTAANNVNFGIKHATGDIVKLLYMDDFFVDGNALAKIARAFSENEGKWLISGFVCCNQERDRFYNSRQPWYGNKFVNGDNTTGNPSNYSVRRECALEMDENLKWIVDGEYFYRSYYHYGDPIMLADILVCFREHGDSAFLKPEFAQLDASERQYCVDKFSGVVEQKLI
ncbi:MAG: glycosyltransferase family 2 protein [Methylococcales bacterium]